MGKVLTICQRCLARLWGALGLCVVFSALRTFDPHDRFAFVPLALGATLAVGACGFFFDKRWGRVSLGCLLVLVVLWCADMLLFIAFRGFGSGRVLLLFAVLGLVMASICTWSLLAVTHVRDQ
jgi:hypothetical protein